jgi:hypothetical protein
MSMNNSRPFNAEPQLQRTNKDLWLSQVPSLFMIPSASPQSFTISSLQEIHFLAHLLSIILILMELCFTDPSIWLSDP